MHVKLLSLGSNGNSGVHDQLGSLTNLQALSQLVHGNHFLDLGNFQLVLLCQSLALSLDLFLGDSQAFDLNDLLQGYRQLSLLLSLACFSAWGRKALRMVFTSPPIICAYCSME